MDNQQKKRIENNIKNLDYLAGTGVIGGRKKTLADELFVFISAGGSGRAALINLKKTMKNQVEDSDFKEKTMFLAVDSDWNEQDNAVNNGDLDSTEIVKLPYVGAHKLINPDNTAPQTKKWVHPELWSHTGGAGADITPPACLNGTGAGAMRQCGRLLFCQSQAQTMYQQSLAKVITKLRGKGSRKVKVFFLVGIAGGTGSGTVVDLAYLTKYFLRKLLGTAYPMVNFYGYLLLPSACGNQVNDTTTGNQNAYAALKEIDYYMTITARKEHFVMDYGTSLAKDVDIETNIFDFCTLVEGVGANGVFMEDNAESARGLIADSILNVACADQAKNVNGQQLFLMDSFHSNDIAKTHASIVAQSHRDWPRNANYIYSVLGISSCIIPVDLLTSYVVKKVFDALFRKFRKAEDVNDERTVDFITNCGLDVDELAKRWNVTSKESVKNDAQAQVDAEFKAYGPYYVVNLLKKAVDFIENDIDDYKHKAQSNKAGFLTNPLGRNDNKWDNVIAKYEEAVRYFRDQNQNLYEVYTYVIKILREQIEKNAGILTETNEYERVFGKSFYWTPIDLTPGNDATVAVEKYLEGFYNNGEAEKLADEFIEDLCEKRDKWTQLATESGNGKFDAAGEVRDFIKEHLEKCIDTTLEKFIVITYSGEEKAEIKELDDNGKEVPSKQTYEAAEMLLSELNNHACAMASTSEGFLDSVNRNEYITMPKRCDWLHKAIEEKCADYKILPENIYLSTANDRVVLSRNYSGVPAWALNWTVLAETDYEKEGPNKVGMHTDQGEDSNWAELPNLYPESKWTKTEAEQRKREAKISAKIRGLMDEAKELGMLRTNIKEPEYHDLILVREGATAAELREKAELREDRRYEIAEVLDILVEKGAATRDKLSYTGMVMTTTDTLAEDELKAFRYDLACQTMRMLHSKWEPLRKCIETVKELQEILPIPVPLVKLNSFIDALVYGAIEYDADQMSWLVTVHDEEVLGEALTDKFQRQCAHYYGFVAFSELDDVQLADIKEYSTEKRKAKGALASDRKELNKYLSDFRSAKKGTEKPWSDQSPFAADGNEASWPMGSTKFAKKADKETDNIRRFYDNLIENL